MYVFHDSLLFLSRSSRRRRRSRMCTVYIESLLLTTTSHPQSFYNNGPYYSGALIKTCHVNTRNDHIQYNSSIIYNMYLLSYLNSPQVYLHVVRSSIFLLINPHPRRIRCTWCTREISQQHYLYIISLNII